MQRTGTGSTNAKWLNKPFADASSISILFPIFGSKCSTMGSMHPKWHAGVLPAPEGAITTVKRFPFSSYVENTFSKLFRISALVDVSALSDNIFRDVP